MPYDPPAWMTEHILDALGGRDNVVALMSGTREAPWTNMPLWQAQRDMEGKMALLTRLHGDGELAEHYMDGQGNDE